MKKIKFFLFGLLMFICFVLPVKADGTKTYYIEANILSNGDMQVKELKKLSGTYNGVKTTLRYSNNNLQSFTGILDDFEGSNIYNASSITDLKVYDVINTDFNFKVNNEFELVNYANTGNYGVYTRNDFTGGTRLLIYMPSSYNRASLVTYTVKDVVVVHNDIAEIAWDFIGSDYEEEIDDLKIVINLPGDSNELRVFSHGPLNGTNRIINKSSVELVNPNVPAYNAIDMRVVFDKELVSGASKKSNIDGLANILEIEKKRADEANTLREEAKAREESKQLIINIIKVVSIAWFIGLIIIVYKIYKKYDKEYKSDFDIQYYREIPSEYSPEIVSYLMYKDIKQETFGAAILELIRKKILILEEVQVEKKKLFGTKTKKDYKLSKNPNFKEESLSELERKILSLIINTIGNGTHVYLEEITDYSKDYINAKKFMKEYDNWKAKAIEISNLENFYESTFKVKLKSTLYSLIMPALSFLTLNLTLYLGKFYLLNIFSIVAIIYFISFNKRTKKGNDEYVKWNALKNFLNDFGRMNEKEILEITLWEKYLVYATVFGIADKVQEVMKIKLQDINYNNADFTFLYLHDLYFYNTLNNTISRSISNARTTITQHEMAQSARSSSSGFGGGSSSGGGGFGGGGSGGGRF